MIYDIVLRPGLTHNWIMRVSVHAFGPIFTQTSANGPVQRVRWAGAGIEYINFDNRRGAKWWKRGVGVEAMHTTQPSGAKVYMTMFAKGVRIKVHRWSLEVSLRLEINWRWATSRNKEERHE